MKESFLKGTCGRVLSMIIICALAFLWTVRAKAALEPWTLALVGSGLLLFGLVLRRKMPREET